MDENNQVDVVVEHPELGKHLLFMRKHTFDIVAGTPSSRRCPYSYVFYYPSGAFMGELDEAAGGGLSHPNEEVNRYIWHCKNRMGNEFSFMDATPDLHRALERSLVEFIYERDPDFFDAEVLESFGLAEEDDE